MRGASAFLVQRSERWRKQQYLGLSSNMVERMNGRKAAHRQAVLPLPLALRCGQKLLDGVMQAGKMQELFVHFTAL